MTKHSFWQRTALWWLVLIVLLGTATRLFQLETRSLWADEGWTLVLAKGPSVADIVQRLANDQHPPLYFILLHWWRDAVGDTEFALRMLSVLTGLIAIAAIYQLGKALYSPLTGILAAFLLAVWDHHIDLSQDVRHYSQLATLIILSSWFYFLLVRRPNPSWGNRLGYVFLSIALLYSHYLGGFVLICHAVHMLIVVRPWSRLRFVLVHFGVVCFGFLPWFPIVLEQNRVRWQTPLYYLNSLPNSEATYRMVRDAVLGQQYALFSVLILVAVLWSLSFWQWRSSVFLLLLWGVGYFVMSYYLNSILGRQFLTIRNFIVMTPAVLLLIAFGLSQLQGSLRLLMVSVILLLSLTTIDTRQLKPPWREVFQNVTTYHNPGEAVLMDIWVGDFPGRYYIEQQIGEDTPWLSLREARDDYKSNFLPVVKGYVQERDAFWLVFWQSIPVDEMPYAEGFAQAGFQRTATLSVDHAGNQIYSYRYDRVQENNVATFYTPEQPLIVLNRYEYTNSVSAGTVLPVQLFLIGLENMELDYSVSVFLLNENDQAIIAHDSPPLLGNSPTSAWQPGQLVFDEHPLRLPNALPAGQYDIGVKIYHYQNPNSPLATCAERNECEWVVIGQLTVE